MLERQTQSYMYWAETFKVNEADIDHLYNVLLEREEPLSADQMALVLVRRRVHEESLQLEEQFEDIEVYRPAATFEIGQDIVFPVFHFARGKITGIRPSISPEHSEFQVIQVQFEDEESREFASQLQADHVLNKGGDDSEDELLSAEELFIEYGDEVVVEIENYLADHDDIVRIASRWFPKSLLADIHIGHLNLAEAVLDMAGGGPLDTPAILEQVDLSDDVNPHLQEFSMNYALQEDERFDEVGPAGLVAWYLHRLEPPEVHSAPLQLTYQPVEHDRELLTAELLTIERELQDELSPLKTEQTNTQSVTITLTYPHRRAGTLPLSARLKPFFPTAYITPVIRFVLIDEHSGDELPGWVALRDGYVFGLAEWYERYDVPIGGYLKISRTDDPGQVTIGYAKRRPRSEWVRVASVIDKRPAFEMKQRPIGSDYDDLMIVTVDDMVALDEFWQAGETGRDLDHLIHNIFGILAGLSAQNAVDVRTLYSAINVFRRCPPGPIFERLLTLNGYKHVGGAYWRYQDGE